MPGVTLFPLQGALTASAGSFVSSEANPALPNMLLSGRDSDKVLKQTALVFETSQIG